MTKLVKKSIVENFQSLTDDTPTNRQTHLSSRPPFWILLNFFLCLTIFINFHLHFCIFIKLQLKENFLRYFPPDVFTLQSCVRKMWNTILLFSFFNHALFKHLQSQDLLHWFRPYLILADNFWNFPTYSTQTFFEQIPVEANSFSRKYPWN